MFGEAFLLQRYETAEKVVVKHVCLDNLDECDVNCALKEVAALSKLEHPNIVRCYGGWVCKAGDPFTRPWSTDSKSARLPIQEALHAWATATDDGMTLSTSSINILTEYMDGGSLDTVIAGNSQIDEMLVGIWLAQILLGVDHMHRNHVLHRDIKPANIFITQSGVVKLGDFGCCKMLRCPDQECKSEYGTPTYLSPEIWHHGICSHKSDVWAIGCLSHELFARQPPFSGPDLAQQVVSHPPPVLPSHCSDAMCDIISKMLEKNPNERPGTREILDSAVIAGHVARWMEVAF